MADPGHADWGRNETEDALGTSPWGCVKPGCGGEERWCELSADTDVPLPVKMQSVPPHQWEGGTGTSQPQHY